MEMTKNYIIKDKISGFYVHTVKSYQNHSVTNFLPKALVYNDLEDAKTVAKELNKYSNLYYKNAFDYRVYEKHAGNEEDNKETEVIN